MAKETKLNLINILATLLVGALVTYYFTEQNKKIEKGEKAYEEMYKIKPTILNALDTLSLSNTYRFTKIYEQQNELKLKINSISKCLRKNKIYTETALQLVELKSEQDLMFSKQWDKKHYDVAVNDSVWDYNEKIRANKEITRENQQITITRKNGISDDASKYLRSNKQN